jgi:hypothetical protein
MPRNDTVVRLYLRSLAASLYADSKAKVSLPQLAAEYGRSERWVSERIEAARLCLEKQVRIEML